MKFKSPITLFAVLVACIAAMAFAGSSLAGTLVSTNTCLNMASNSQCTTGGGGSSNGYSRMSLTSGGAGVNKCAGIGTYPRAYGGMRCDNAAYTYSTCYPNHWDGFGINQSPKRRDMKIVLFRSC